MMKLKLVAPIALLAFTMPMLAGCADKKPAETAVSTEETRTVVAQPVEIGPERIGAKQFGVAGIELLQRYGMSSLPGRLLKGILNEIDGPVHRFAP